MEFADIVDLVIINQYDGSLENVANESLAHIADWIDGHGLELAHANTEAVTLTNKWAFRPPVIVSGVHVVPISRTVKSLAVLLDLKLMFSRHLRAV